MVKIGLVGLLEWGYISFVFEQIKETFGMYLPDIVLVGNMFALLIKAE